MGGLIMVSFAKVGYLSVQVVLFCVAILSSSGVAASAPSCQPSAGTPVVRDLSDTHGNSYGVPGLSHLTVAGALLHGQKEVEVWLETIAPGTGTPVHKHNCEEVLLILKGKGTFYLASSSDSPYPGKPREFSISANSTFAIPVNAVHQMQNTNQDEDMQALVIISRPPIKAYTYKDWETPHTEAQEFFPIPWDADLISSTEGQCGASFTGTSY